MKIVRHLHPFLLLLMFSLALAPAGWAQAPTEDPVQTQEAPPAPTPPAEPEKQEAPADPTAEATPTQADEEGMRELGNADEPEVKAAEPEKKPEKQGHDWRHGAREGVSIGGNSTLEEDEYAAEVVSILGSSTSAGHVRGAVVSILGGSRVTGGTVGDNVVSVLGNTYVNGEVKGEVIAVLGNVELGPQAVVRGDVVCIAGQFKRAPGAVFRGEVHNVGFAGGRFDFSKLGAWFSECLVQGRLLAFDSRLVWAWVIALVALGLYALIALIAPAGVNRCVETLEERPGSSLLAALLAMLLTPVAYILLALTLAIAIGVILIPLFSLGLFFASVFGKIVMLAWLGRRFTRLMGDGPAAHPVFGVLIGGVVVLLLYATPFVGIAVYKLLGVLGLGVVVYTIIRHTKANRPSRPPVAVPSGVAVVSPVPTPV
ncbi:MAG TPA: polymer-forming cytoskeletal protein, partial [Lacunisphaera sp.]|nr:polymer-forming cytoskeletal protein [Lacunisphaera sp.]